MSTGKSKGPCLPPALIAQREQKKEPSQQATEQGSEGKQSNPKARIIGPPRPDNLTCKRPNDDEESSSSSEEDVRSGARHDLMADLNERIKDSMSRIDDKDRDRIDKRTGKKLKSDKNEKKTTSNIKLLGAVLDEGTPEVDESAYYEDRGPSLMELHRQKRIEKHREKNERRSGGQSSSSQAQRLAFDRERDLKVNMYDSKRSREIMNEARKMQERFSSGKYT